MLTTDQIRAGQVAGLEPEANADTRAGRQPGLGILVDAIDHFVGLVGSDHVGIGTDFKDQWGYYPEPFTDSSRTPVVADALLARGRSPANVERIMGGSVLRVIRSALG